jgi:hypothetical protein
MVPVLDRGVSVLLPRPVVGIDLARLSVGDIDLLVQTGYGERLGLLEIDCTVVVSLSG